MVDVASTGEDLPLLHAAMQTRGVLPGQGRARLVNTAPNGPRPASKRPQGAPAEPDDHHAARGSGILPP
ncbi:hypothetical protein KCH_30980 [Kitasatospora cheerisanensis KCTC 2395]|uniref:Uncharacterized protein n=1 Tax=Kitasatospora cheerisanensis KCTC 2395 TaxID=1348663 RepID=A0A066YYC1_9ACTN|nr:hypothetical protein KCH_30980 [Kitasatospora cheerisanensis KCTC 2395]